MNKNILPALLVALVAWLFVSCSAPAQTTAVGEPSSTPRPTSTSQPSQTPIPSATATPLPISTPTAIPISYPIFFQTPIPEPLTITSQNIHQLQQLQHTNKTGIQGVDFTDNGKWIIVKTAGKVIIHDAQTFEALTEKPYDEFYRLIPHSNLIILNNTVWNLETMKSAFTLRGQFQDISADGKLLITTQAIMNTETGAFVQSVSADAAAISPDGSYHALLRKSENAILLMAQGASEPIARIPYDEKQTQAFFFSPDGQHLLVRVFLGSKSNWEPDLRLRAYSVERGIYANEILFPLSGYIQAGQPYYFLRNNDIKASGAFCFLYFYRSYPQQPAASYTIPSPAKVCQDITPSSTDPMRSARFWGDVFTIATYFGDGPERQYRLDVWNLETRQLLFERLYNLPTIVIGASPMLGRFATYAEETGILEILDADGNTLYQMDGLEKRTARALAFSEDGTLAASIQNNDVFIIHDLTGEKADLIVRVANLNDYTSLSDRPSPGLKSLHFIDEDRLLFVVASDGFRIYDLAEGKITKSLSLRGGFRDDLLFAVLEDGKTGLLPTTTGVDRYNLIKLQREVSYTAPGRKPMAWVESPDGSLLAIGGEKNQTIFVFDVVTARTVHTLAVTKFVPLHIAISPDSNWLVTNGTWTGGRKILQIWDLQSGALHQEFELTGEMFSQPGGYFNIEMLIFSPDSSYFIVGLTGNQPGIYLWRPDGSKPFAFSRTPSKSLQFLDEQRWMFGTIIWGIPAPAR
jgi:WD40 repeat protein